MSAFLGKAPDVAAAIRITHVGVDDGLREPGNLQALVLRDDVVELQDPPRFRQCSEPLQVGDDDVVLLALGGERRRGFLEEVGKGSLGETERDVISISLLDVISEKRGHLHAERRRQPAGDAEDIHVNLLAGQRMGLHGSQAVHKGRGEHCRKSRRAGPFQHGATRHDNCRSSARIFGIAHYGFLPFA